LWYVWSHGKHGARNGSHLCKEVVDLYRRGAEEFHKLALETREILLQESVAPRLELREESGPGLLQPDLSGILSEQSGLPRQGLIIYNRAGTILDGIVLNAEVLGAAVLAGVGFTVGSRLVKLVEKALTRHRMKDQSPIAVLRNGTWRILARGSESEFELAVISRYIPEFDGSVATPLQRRLLAGYLLILLGVRRLNEPEHSTTHGSPHSPSRTRVRQLERAVGTSLSGLSGGTLIALDELVNGAESKAFRKTIRRARKRRPALIASNQRSLDEFR
jgi:hypothetical protein